MKKIQAYKLWACLILVLAQACGGDKGSSLSGSKPCPMLEFTYTKTNPSKYTFTAAFEGINDIPWYAWRLNGEFLAGEEEGVLNQGDNILELTFTEPGTYEIGITTILPECPEGMHFSLKITVQL